MTVVEKILLAAHALEQGGTSPFTAEELVVRCWQMDKDLFGLQGYSSDYPDSNRILTNIMGSKGLKAKGWIEKVGEKQYRLTATGTRVALTLSGGDRTGHLRASDLIRRELPIVFRMINSPAYNKHLAKQDGSIIFRDACNFWGISSYSDAEALRTQFQAIRNLVDVLEKAVAESPTGTVMLPEMKVSINEDTVGLVRETHELLQKLFFNELQVIRNRARRRVGV